MCIRDRPDTPPEEIDLTHITKRQISTITKRDIINYLDYARSNDNGAKARARKLSALRGFFGYLCHQINELSENPTDNINLGSPKKSLPKYLSASESIRLLKNIQSDFYERDYCIIVFFLNCGMRLAELITINLGDFKDDTIKITGKGNKERLVYLNTACQAALEHYLPARAALNNLRDKEALFVSKKTGRRLTARRVEQIVANCLKSAGLDNMGYSPHKLRHTAATLMYQGLSLIHIFWRSHCTRNCRYYHQSRQLGRVGAAQEHCQRHAAPCGEQLSLCAEL